MRTIFYGTCIVAALALAAVSGGCGSQQSSDDTPVDVSGPPPAADGHGQDHDGHDHGEEHEGPHGGHVIELGRNHQYHAELVEDEQAGTVTVYMLDKDLKELVIDQPAIVMNLTVDGQAKTFELVAADASAGKASRFEAADRALFEALHEHEATGKLRVTIDGTPYSGEVEHYHHHGDHDDDHGHAHGDEHKH